uniref:Hmgi/y n=1 Tax=Arundo donax TaxID=35708 RepID=A0A0A9EG72_ARUDO
MATAAEERDEMRWGIVFLVGGYKKGGGFGSG